jgi:hypothetical protein
VQLVALLGIPAAGGVAIVLSLQIPRFIYGQAVPLLFTAEIGSLITLLALLLALRAYLTLPSARSGFYRTVLDFLAPGAAACVSESRTRRADGAPSGMVSLR